MILEAIAARPARQPDAFTEGQVVTVICAPGYPTRMAITILSATPRVVIAKPTHYDHLPAETYTLRKNGRYARKGGGQWRDYLQAMAR